MACGCRSGAKRTQVASTPGVRSRVRFFVSPPPEVGGEALAFSTVYAARAALREHPGWHLESRRVPVE